MAKARATEAAKAGSLMKLIGVTAKGIEREKEPRHIKAAKKQKRTMIMIMNASKIYQVLPLLYIPH